ncbi:hypothetical protein, partial [Arachidicoccus sp.]|uniref:hypothetical protein n=1 Tax=Arachidicoccus sp. TaxID=1872624 RepID=UPI003D1A3759
SNPQNNAERAKLFQLFQHFMNFYSLLNSNNLFTLRSKSLGDPYIWKSVKPNFLKFSGYIHDPIINKTRSKKFHVTKKFIIEVHKVQKIVGAKVWTRFK